MGHGTDYNLENMLSIVSPVSGPNMFDDKFLFEASQETPLVENLNSLYEV